MSDLISRKAVLSILHNKAFDSVRNDEKYNLLCWCMKQIENLPTIQQGIDKDRLIEKLMSKDFAPSNFVNKQAILLAIIDFINQQPTLDGWIPVSSGELPSDDNGKEYYDSVIVTLDTGRVVDGCYVNRDKEWWVDAEDGERYSIDATGHVIAWRPLPPAYKESE